MNKTKIERKCMFEWGNFRENWCCKVVRHPITREKAHAYIKCGDISKCQYFKTRRWWNKILGSWRPWNFRKAHLGWYPE